MHFAYRTVERLSDELIVPIVSRIEKKEEFIPYMQFSIETAENGVDYQNDRLRHNEREKDYNFP